MDRFDWPRMCLTSSSFFLFPVTNAAISIVFNCPLLISFGLMMGFPGDVIEKDIEAAQIVRY
jgi:hypothetical protein